MQLISHFVGRSQKFYHVQYILPSFVVAMSRVELWPGPNDEYAAIHIR